MSENNLEIPSYRIHPGIGIARLGDSPDEFCISPEKPASLPLACDREGNPLRSSDGKSDVPITKFKDKNGRIKRQAARFQLYVYDDKNPDGRPLKLGDEIKGGGNHGVLVDIQWQVYLANKKSSWYEFNGTRGEHGYLPDHPRRNADITDPEERQALIIDPGAQIVNSTTRRSARLDKSNTENYAPVFPPRLNPNSIETLGEILSDNNGRLLVLGGHGNSGTFKTGFGQPRIDSYANTDGWFDDTSDGVVMARLVMYSKEVGRIRYVDVEYPAWVMVGYPRYVPEILDMITAEDVVEDLAIREFAYRTDIYGDIGTFDDPQTIDPNDTGALLHWKRGRLGWNPDYKPWFYRDIWTILFRPDEMTYLTNVLSQSNFPHNQSPRGTFDPEKLSVPPVVLSVSLEKARQKAIAANSSGELFLDALEPTLALLDERLKSKLEGDFRSGLLEAFYESDIRENLQKLVSGFAAIVESIAQAVFDKKGLTGDPAEYLVRWRKIADIPNDQDIDPKIKTKYLQASEKLIDDLEKIVNELHERLKPKLDVSDKGFESIIAPRVTVDEKAKKDSAISIQDSFELHSKAFRSGKMLVVNFDQALMDATFDPYKILRAFLYNLLRQEGEENEFRGGGDPNSRLNNLPLMPLLAGDNPVSNTAPSKFLRLTDYQLYILRQWAEGKFYNEMSEGWVKDIDPYEPYKNWTNETGRDLDRGVLSNMLGGAFFPGGEIGWIIRNPSIFKEPYRLRADPDFYNLSLTAAQASARGVSPVDYVAYSESILSQNSDFGRGLQPGDLSKQMALPWQADFNECTTQGIDITYEDWNSIAPDSENDIWAQLESQAWETLWWPAHRPLQVNEVVGFSASGAASYQNADWSRGIPPSHAGDLKMVTEWSKLGFVIRNPYLTEKVLDTPSPDYKYINTEQSQED